MFTGGRGGSLPLLLSLGEVGGDLLFLFLKGQVGRELEERPVRKEANHNEKWILY